MVYLASSLALAVLETRVHLEVTATQQPYTALEFAWPAELTEDAPPLPKNWQQQDITQEIGSRWLAAQTSLALRVPSIVVAVEFNYLINPLHQAMAQIRPLRRVAYSWDERLF